MENEAKSEKRPMLGDLLVKSGLITQDQLLQAMKIQSQNGGRLGSILVELEYIDVESLLMLLSKQNSVPCIDLYNVVLDPSIVNRLPLAKMKEYGALPLAVGDKGITIAMVNPNNFTAIGSLEFTLGRTVQPVLALASQMTEILKTIEIMGGSISGPIKGSEIKGIKKIKPRPSKQSNQTELMQLFSSLVNDHGSDLLLTAGIAPCIKKGHEVHRLSPIPLNPEQVRAFADELMTDEQRVEFEKFKELDSSYTLPDIGRFRVNIYKQRNSISIAARHIVEKIPRIEDLGLPAWIEDFALKPQGLILITGPTGHGKTTTLAALIDIINTKRRCNIITIEDPIEYLHKHKTSNINQRQVGIDTDSFNDGLRHIFRQAPDVIVIGEMRDTESFSIALQAAETGHLVLSTLHANNTTSTIDRVVDIFPPHQQPQIRVQLAESFLLIMNQRLVPSRDGKKRILAYERLSNSVRVKKLIREGKAYQIRTMLQQATDDFLSIDQTLARLCLEGKISQDTGLNFCDNATFFSEMTAKGGGR